MSPQEKLAKMLRTRSEIILDLEEKLNKKTGKNGVVEKIIEENDALVRKTLKELGCPGTNLNAEEVYNSLMARLSRLDDRLYNFLDKPDLAKMSNACGKLCGTAVALNKPQKGFFIKKDRAVELLSKFPPQNLLDHFGCKNTDELIDKQGFSSVFSALRFAQDAKWMHNFFDKAYDNLKAEDFEEREVELKVLETEWLEVAEKFLEKKYHNVSHLKEFGIIFVIPLKIDTQGETLRLFTLILHYLNEVPFYSKLFKKHHLETGFPSKMKSLLRGDVPLAQLPTTGNQLPIRIVQRYLAKDNPDDFRLFEPHINPEAEHWHKAEINLSALPGFEQIADCDSVGDLFGNDLVSFGLIDLVMSLVKKGEVKYLYHQQEALWNKIFIEYLGRGKMNELVEQNIIKGFIKL